MKNGKTIHLKNDTHGTMKDSINWHGYVIMTISGCVPNMRVTNQANVNTMFRVMFSHSCD